MTDDHLPSEEAFPGEDALDHDEFAAGYPDPEPDTTDSLADTSDEYSGPDGYYEASEEQAGEAAEDSAGPDTSGEVAEQPSSLGETERLRQPRAQDFRRRLSNQISMLPFALYLIGLGAYLIARERDIDRLPRLADIGIVLTVLLAFGFTAIFRALVLGRYQRGLLLVGFALWFIIGALLFLAYGLEDEPDAADYWPVVLLAFGMALFLTYAVERTHDTRLVLVSLLVLVTGGVTLWASIEDLSDNSQLDRVIDYWPLLLVVMGIGLIPSVFRPRPR